MNRSPLRHFAVLVLIAVVYTIAMTTYNGLYQHQTRFVWSAAVWWAMLNTYDRIAWYVALMAGIAVGTSSRDQRGIRSALTILAITVGAMVTLDVVVGPAATFANQRAARSYGDAWPMVGDTIIYSSRDSVGLIRVGWRLLRDRPAALHEPLGSSWSQNHPRALLTDVSIRLPRLLLPFVTMGLVLGAVTWLRRHATFALSRDATIARWCVAWVLATAAWSRLLDEPNSYNIEHRRLPYWWPVFLYVPYLVIAALGWRAAARDAQSAGTSPAL